MQDKEKEMQNSMLNYRIMEARIGELARQRDMIIAKIAELESTIGSFGELKKGSDILFSLGGESYIIGRLARKDRMLVDVGAGIIMEKTLADGKTTLSKRKEELEKALSGIDSEIRSISAVMEKLSLQLQKLSQQ